MARLSVLPLAQGFGAAIGGLDLRQPLGDAEVAALHRALDEHALLVIPRQHLAHGDLVAVSRALGDPFVHYVAEYLAPDHPEIMVLSNNFDDEGRPLGAPNNGILWHSDQIFRPKPVSYTLLYGHEVPPVAGDTLFADMRAVADTLPPEVSARLAGRQAVHSFAESYRKNYIAAAPLTADQIAANPDTAHPVLRTHPRTGRRAVFIDPDSTLRIEGLEPAESDALLSLLFSYLDDPAYVYCHHWQAGELVIWDNACLMHRATGYDDGQHRRVMWRTQLHGEVPV